jgi:hypothetical protein
MSVSEKQLAANRANAQKSTGPKTPEGKARSARNATVHGLRSTDTVINTPIYSEDQAEFDSLLKSLVIQFSPDSDAEKRQVFRIAVCMWRLNRLAIAETAQIERQLGRTANKQRMDEILARMMREARPDRPVNPAFLPSPESEERDKRARLLLDEGTSRNFLRYEMRTERSLLRAIQTLREMKGLMRDDDARRSPGTRRIKTHHSDDLRRDPDLDEPRDDFTL